jgi:hypothetical protein
MAMMAAGQSPAALDQTATDMLTPMLAAARRHQSRLVRTCGGEEEGKPVYDVEEIVDELGRPRLPSPGTSQ